MKSVLFLAKTAAHVAAFLLALVCAGGALAAQGGRFSDRLDVLTHFSLLWLAGGLVAGALWMAFVRREGGVFTMVLAAVAVLSSGALMAPELLAKGQLAKAPAEGGTLKLIQFNVWGRNIEPAQTADWIVAQDPDVVVLEEAYSQKDGVARQLASRLFEQTSCAAPNPHCSTRIFYRDRPLAEGGLVSEPEGPYLAAAWVTLPSPAGPFTVVGAHYTWPWPAGPQQAQARRLAARIEAFDKDSLIMAGDFNSTPWSFSMRRQDKAFGLERRTRALPSWPAARFSRFSLPAPFPFLPIDHVYAGKGWRTVSVERGPRLGSDHYPVVVELTRVKAPPARE